MWIDHEYMHDNVQGRGRAFAGPGAGPAQPSFGMTKDQRRNAKALAKLDKQVQQEKPRVYKPLGEEERLEAARQVPAMLAMPA